MLRGQTQGFKLRRTTREVELLDRGVFAATASVAGAFFFLFDLVARHLREVREDVRAQQTDATRGNELLACLVRLIDGLLHFARVGYGGKSALVFYLEEELPCGVSHRLRQHFYVIGTRCGVNHLIEVALFLEQELLIACDTFRKFVGRLEYAVVRQDGDGVNACDGG